VIDAVGLLVAAASAAAAAAVEVVVSILPSGDATADVYKDNQSRHSVSSKYSVCSLSILTGKIKESTWKHFVDATETRKQTLFVLYRLFASCSFLA